MREKKSVVYTVTANCQDCYRCVRVCPVKAISVIDGQAYIEDELCIKCGTCVRECPQGAKTIRSSIDQVKELLESGRKVAVSVAPSFAAVFPVKDSGRLPAALKKLGFHYVSETAEGAKLITEESFRSTTAGNICTACPAVVEYIEKYRPEHIGTMIPVVSPMVAHGRLLKKRLGAEWAVVFIGPCAAKKQEAARAENSDAIDWVLTFTELISWMEEEGIKLEECAESDFESFGILDKARLFPLQGGMLKTGDIDCDGTNADVIHISGAEDVQGLLEIPPESWKYMVVEPLFCSGGCINGPGFPKEKNIFSRKQDIVAYAKKASIKDKGGDHQDINYTAGFRIPRDRAPLADVSEEKIQEILDSTGKSNPEMQLNCGACGYKTCRDNAIAVARGMAETEMCVSYMRRLAQQRADRIIETTPNGIVTLDKEMNIISMNPAFQKMFMCNNAIIGKHISYLLDSGNYEKLAGGSDEQFESIRTKYGVKYHERVYALRDENQYVGIYSDLTKFRFDGNQIDLIKNQTLDQAKELLYHQIRFSQEMAHYLGKSTAKSEEMVKRIMDLYEENDLRKND
ncbi:[Fe-Fe] hydrogenase large subunit C-terminal domain-containing protein [Bacillota bacterium]